MKDNSAGLTTRPKVLAVASIGGHRIQLLRITAALAERAEIVYASTTDDARPEGVDDAHYHVLPDFSRRNPWLLLTAFHKAWKIVGKVRPDLVFTTGAAPGLMVLAAARLRGRRAVWIDSAANVEKMSLSGRIASYIATSTLTQWPHLASRRVSYHGNVFCDDAATETNTPRP